MINIESDLKENNCVYVKLCGQYNFKKYMKL